jgi:hypothetical protein
VNDEFEKAETVMLELDRSRSTCTLRFFVGGREQPVFVDDIPNGCFFAVCALCLLLSYSSSFQLSSDTEGISFTVSIQQVSTSAGCHTLKSHPERWSREWPTKNFPDPILPFGEDY